MIHSEEIWRCPISKSVKYIGQCKRSNQINGDFVKIAKEQSLCRSYMNLQHVGNIGLNLTYY